MGRTDLDIRVSLGNRSYRPTILSTTEKGDLYLFLTLKDLGLHFSRHGGQREHLAVRNFDREWVLDRWPSEREREDLRARFTYQPTGDHVVYLLSLDEAARLGSRVTEFDRGTMTLEVTLDALLDEFPYDVVEGVVARDLDRYLSEVETDWLLGLDFHGGHVVLAVREPKEWSVYGMPLDLPVLEEALEGTTFEEGLIKPLFGAAEFGIEYIQSNAQLVQTLEADARTVAALAGDIAEEIYTRLDRQVGMTYSPDRTQS